MFARNSTSAHVDVETFSGALQINNLLRHTALLSLRAPSYSGHYLDRQDLSALTCERMW
jgi:hypothetical protein